LTYLGTLFGHMACGGNRRFLLAVSTVLVLALAITGCQPVEQTPPGTQDLVDDLGRLVTVEGTPQRIVSLSPANTEILFALGLGDNVVGVTDWCNYPPEAMEKHSVGGFYPPNLEEIIAVDPDLVLATDIHRHEGIPALEDMGFTVFALAPQTLDEVMASIHKAGQVMGVEEQALQLVTEMESEIQQVEEALGDLEERPRVLYMTWHDPVWTVGRNTWIDDLITIAGGENIFSQYFESGAMVELEWIVALDPEVIITGMWSYDWAINATELVGINATETGRIYEMDDDLVQRYTPRLIQGLEWFAHYIHPAIFDEPDGD